jgi:flavodoxin
MYEVLYYAFCGNGKSICKSTREIAEAISLELDVAAREIKEENTISDDSIIFLGSSCYGTKPGGILSEFIGSTDFTGRQVVLFGTILDGKKNKLKTVEELLNQAGASVKGSYYCLRKAMPFLHKSHATQDELNNAREFAGKMKNS